MTTALYAGPFDGAEVHISPHVDAYIHNGLIEDEFGQPHQRCAQYRRSNEWSRHFGKPVFIAAGFKGRPPAREFQTS